MTDTPARGFHATLYSITSPSGVPQMAFFTAASKADFQHQLQAALAQHISEQALPQVALFAEQFFGIISLAQVPCSGH